MKKVLVFGATSGVGAEVVKQLSETETTIVGTSRQPNQKDSTSQLSWKQYEAGQNQDLSQLFVGVDRVFLMSPPGYAEQDKIFEPLLEAAQAAQVEKVVMMTAIGVDANDEIPFRKAELQLEQSGLSYAIIRPNWFNQNFHTFWVQGILEQKKILVPAGAGKTSFIDVQDIGACAAQLLLSNQKENRAFNLTGPEALDYHEAAKKISQASQQAIQYEDIDPQVFKENLMHAQLPEDYANLLVGLFGVVKAGYVGGVTNDVQDLLGREPIPFDAYTKAHQQIWQQA